MPSSPYLVTPGDNAGYIKNSAESVSAPGPFVEMGWAVRLEATSAISSATLVLRVYLLTIEGETIPIEQTMTITGTGIQTGVEARVGRGWIIGLSVRATAGTISETDIIASVHVTRNAGTTLEYLMTLASGQVTRTRALGLNAYTGSGSSSTSIAPPIANATAANPSVGTDWTVTVPAGQTWKLLYARAFLTCAAVVATREVGFLITNGSTTLVRFAAPVSQTSGSTRAYAIGQFGNTYAAPVTTGTFLNTPEVYLGAGYTFGTATTAIDAGDQWSQLAYGYLLYT